ncbi:unnamed protein product [Microthlaspi erraticum]|uniref:Uncharacterized protein n=1 Tax=Microthlaspi erraticum TaxID=1685480 RepID=A0A6D2JE35_9BRAS|nr:unnamed protein product [Microthlaspi erraticum]
MDFIKTSSLRALIELTFQRNWNGFIWMSRKGVIAKRVKTAPDGSIENQRPNRAVRLAEERMFRARPKPSPSEVSAKVQTTGRSQHDPGNIVPRSAKHNAHATAHDQPREPGTSLAAAQLPYHGRCIRPSRGTPTSGREPSAKSSSVRPAGRPIIRPRRPFRLGQDPTVRPIVPTDRPNAAVDPKPFLKPNPHNSSPKPAPT